MDALFLHPNMILEKKLKHLKQILECKISVFRKFIYQYLPINKCHVTKKNVHHRIYDNAMS